MISRWLSGSDTTGQSYGKKTASRRDASFVCGFDAHWTRYSRRSSIPPEIGLSFIRSLPVVSLTLNLPANRFCPSRTQTNARNLRAEKSINRVRRHGSQTRD